MVSEIKLKDRTFMYVDKERIIRWIDSRIANPEVDPQYRSALLQIRYYILEGLFDWQPAE